MVSDGAPYEMKVSRTVRSGGKPEDDIKGLPIAIASEALSQAGQSRIPETMSSCYAKHAR